jgi:hypothetical protein
MKTATITLPEPTISPRCTLSASTAEHALGLLKNDIREFTDSLSTCAVVGYYSPPRCTQVMHQFGKLRGAVWMASFCGVIDGEQASNICDAALAIVYGEYAA